jgi:hypothetical protein
MFLLLLFLVLLKIMMIAFVFCAFNLEKVDRESIAPEIENLNPALSMRGMISIATLIARKLEPLMIQRETRISHTFDC